MKIVQKINFRDYNDFANQNSKELLERGSPFLDAIEKHHLFLNENIFEEISDLSHSSFLLAVNSFMLLNAALRTAISGHQAAIFPVLRTALESACYSFLVNQRSDLQKIWSTRHSTEETLKLCRKEFNSAVNKTALEINKLSFIKVDFGSFIIDCYQNAIDFGAHPNEKSILPHVHLSSRISETSYAAELGCLYKSTSPFTVQSLVACLDFCDAISVILFSNLNEQKIETIGPKLSAVLELKEKAKEDFFQLNPDLSAE